MGILFCAALLCAMSITGGGQEVPLNFPNYEASFYDNGPSRHSQPEQSNLMNKNKQVSMDNLAEKQAYGTAYDNYDGRSAATYINSDDALDYIPQLDQMVGPREDVYDMYDRNNVDSTYGKFPYEQLEYGSQGQHPQTTDTIYTPKLTNLNHEDQVDHGAFHNTLDAYRDHKYEHARSLQNHEGLSFAEMTSPIQTDIAYSEGSSDIGSSDRITDMAIEKGMTNMDSMEITDMDHDEVITDMADKDRIASMASEEGLINMPNDENGIIDFDFANEEVITGMTGEKRTTHMANEEEGIEFDNEEEAWDGEKKAERQVKAMGSPDNFEDPTPSALGKTLGTQDWIEDESAEDVVQINRGSSIEVIGEKDFSNYQLRSDEREIMNTEIPEDQFLSTLPKKIKTKRKGSKVSSLKRNVSDSEEGGTIGKNIVTERKDSIEPKYLNESKENKKEHDPPLKKDVSTDHNVVEHAEKIHEKIITKKSKKSVKNSNDQDEINKATVTKIFNKVGKKPDDQEQHDIEKDKTDLYVAKYLNDNKIIKNVHDAHLKKDNGTDHMVEDLVGEIHNKTIRKKSSKTVKNSNDRDEIHKVTATKMFNKTGKNPDDREYHDIQKDQTDLYDENDLNKNQKNKKEHDAHLKKDNGTDHKVEENVEKIHDNAITKKSNRTGKNPNDRENTITKKPNRIVKNPNNQENTIIKKSNRTGNNPNDQDEIHNITFTKESNSTLKNLDAQEHHTEERIIENRTKEFDQKSLKNIGDWKEKSKGISEEKNSNETYKSMHNQHRTEKVSENKKDSDSKDESKEDSVKDQFSSGEKSKTLTMSKDKADGSEDSIIIDVIPHEKEKLHDGDVKEPLLANSHSGETKNKQNSKEFEHKNKKLGKNENEKNAKTETRGIKNINKHKNNNLGENEDNIEGSLNGNKTSDKEKNKLKDTINKPSSSSGSLMDNNKASIESNKSVNEREMLTENEKEETTKEFIKEIKQDIKSSKETSENSDEDKDNFKDEKSKVEEEFLVSKYIRHFKPLDTVVNQGFSLLDLGQYYKSVSVVPTSGLAFVLKLPKTPGIPAAISNGQTMTIKVAVPASSCLNPIVPASGSLSPIILPGESTIPVVMNQAGALAPTNNVATLAVQVQNNIIAAPVPNLFKATTIPTQVLTNKALISGELVTQNYGSNILINQASIPIEEGRAGTVEKETIKPSANLKSVLKPEPPLDLGLATSIPITANFSMENKQHVKAATDLIDKLMKAESLVDFINMGLAVKPFLNNQLFLYAASMVLLLKEWNVAWKDIAEHFPQESDKETAMQPSFIGGHIMQPRIADLYPATQPSNHGGHIMQQERTDLEPATQLSYAGRGIMQSGIKDLEPAMQQSNAGGQIIQPWVTDLVPDMRPPNIGGHIMQPSVTDLVPAMGSVMPLNIEGHIMQQGITDFEQPTQSSNAKGSIMQQGIPNLESATKTSNVRGHIMQPGIADLEPATQPSNTVEHIMQPGKANLDGSVGKENRESFSSYPAWLTDEVALQSYSDWLADDAVSGYDDYYYNEDSNLNSWQGFVSNK